jgi:hypothetical protein
MEVGGAGGCLSSCPPGQICAFPLSHANGQPGQLSTVRATGGACANGGNGGFEANVVSNPSPNGQSSSGTTAAGGGGGGGDGSIVLHTRDTTHRLIATGSIISPAPVTGNVTAN